MSLRRPAGETLEFADGLAQLWAKRLANGSVAALFVNLGKAPLTHSFGLQALLALPKAATSVGVRDVWGRRSGGAPIAPGGSLTFHAVAGHDSRFVVLTPNVPSGLAV